MEFSYADHSGQEPPIRSDALNLIKTEDAAKSYGSLKEDAGANTRGDLVYNPHTLLWIKSVEEKHLTTDDDSEAKESSQKPVCPKTRAKTTEKVIRRRPRFTAAEEFVLVRELLEHYDKLFGTRARITPFAQKVSIWQKVLENVNSVGVLQRGIEEAKKHWYLYKHRLVDKLVAMQKQAPGSGSEQSLLARLTPLESKAANLFKLEYVLRSSQYPSVVQQAPGSQSSTDVAEDARKEGLCALNGNGGEHGGSGFGLADYTLSKAPRNIKFSFDENCALVHEAVGVWDSIIGRNAATTSQARKNFLWSRIVDAVNAAGSQPRSAENCKKRLRDIKRRVKAKMADQRKYSQHNGGGPCLELQYLSYEEELMHVIGPDTIRPVEGHVDTDREPRKYEPEEENCYEDDFWNHSSFDMAEEEEDDDKEMVIKMEPIDYSKDAPTPSPQSFPSTGPPLPTAPQPCIASQLHIPSTKPIVTTRPSLIPAKPIPTATKSHPAVTKPLPLSNKPSLVTTKPQMISNPHYSSLTAPSNYPNTSNPGTINKVVGTLHTAQRHYHRSQRHQMHVLHMDLLHLGVGVQQLTRNVKVNNHIRATERAREFRLKQKAIDDQQQYRMEKLRLLQQHHEAKLRIIQEHYAKKEKLMHENNLLLKGILQRFSSHAGTCLAASCSTDEHSTSHIKAPSTHSDPSPPTLSSDKQTSKGVRTRGGKGREGI
ncbi:uncharacterized protein [Eleutherodactylus coqui]|uniref:Myb/SANT-like DNA-binding domain-containing protein n=1 Tax=Eleutherodactylus coqui TaxID=57060 RepID=A0A8J6F0V6_ELECQ|nr:hypothetical protein GDO78_013260 [Eleutherodactylus coqui]